MKERVINVIKLLISFLIFFNIGYILLFILGLFNKNMNNIGDKTLVLLEFIISLIIFIISLLLYYKEFKKDYKEFKKNIENKIWYILKMFVVFMVVKYIVSFMSLLILELLGMDIESLSSVNQNTINEYAKINPILVALIASFIGPIYEEIIFRLGIKKVVRNKYLFIVFSGLIFGLLHIFPLDENISLTLGLIQSISYVTMGIFLAYIYEKKKNIFYSIGLHILNNLLGILSIIGMM